MHIEKITTKYSNPAVACVVMDIFSDWGATEILRAVADCIEAKWPEETSDDVYAKKEAVEKIITASNHVRMYE